MLPKAGRSGRHRLSGPFRNIPRWVQYDCRGLRVNRNSRRSLIPADPPALKLLHVTGRQCKSGGISYSRAGSVKKKDAAEKSLDGGVEELTKSGENDGQWAPQQNQSADHCTDLGDTDLHPRCLLVFRAAISAVT